VSTKIPEKIRVKGEWWEAVEAMSETGSGQDVDNA